MTIICRIKMSISALAVSLTLIATPSASAEEIFIDAITGSKWIGTCGQCVANGNSVVVSVEPQDVIVFRQKDTSTSHGVMARNAGEAAKIRKRGDAGDGAWIVEELGTGPTKIGGDNSMKFPKIEDGAQPVEMTRIRVRDNFTGALILMCNVHGPGMQITLKTK